MSNGEVAITGCDKSLSGDITIPSTFRGYPITKISDRALQSRSLLTSITIPDSVTSIDAAAFCGCK